MANEEQPSIATFIEVVTLRLQQEHEARRDLEKKFEKFQEEVRLGLKEIREARTEDKEALRASTSAFGKHISTVEVSIAGMKTELRVLMTLVLAAIVAIIGVFVRLSIGGAP